MKVDMLWDKFLERMKDRTSEVAYTTWFKDTKIHKIIEGTVFVIVPLAVHKKHLVENYGEIIEETFNLLTGTNFEISYLLEEDIVDTNVNDNSNAIISTPGHNSMHDELNEVGVPVHKYSNTNLKQHYTFDSYMVGTTNKFAHAAALAVAENPGKIYNPLFLYANSGLGKTHLMHAVGNYILKNTHKQVLYVTSEQFINDFLEINKRDQSGSNFSNVDAFKAKYRKIDVLIIDDIQFLGHATKTQAEFFHTFNNLYDDNKQIIISSDRSPDDLKILEDRLRTRFNWGLTANIYPPDFELRIAILKNKIKGQYLVKQIPMNVIEYIASNCESDVRQLEGAVTRLYAFAAIMNSDDINLDLAIEALKDYLNKNIVARNSLQRIQNVVSSYYNITIADLKSKRRVHSISFPRQIAMYLCRTMTDESFPKIGIEFGGKDHTTVMHSVKQIELKISKDPELRKIIEELKMKIN